MTENILVHAYGTSVEALERALVSWKREGSNSKLACEIEEALLLCSHWPDNAEDICRAVWRRVVAHQIDDFDKAGELVLGHFDNMLKTGEELCALVHDRVREGCSIKGAAELENLMEKLNRMRQKFVDTWPWFNEALIEEAKAEYARGEYQTVREILDELQGKNP